MTKELEELNKLIREKKNKREDCYLKINQLKTKPFSKPKEFKHHCPVGECKGFLSKQWKCAVCSTWACSKCHNIIGLKKDDPHVCKQSDIDSVEEIRKTTKPCPTCAVPINKSVGCNQMWCTQCQVAFDWKTGEIQNGVIHNPHFFEAKRTGMIRAPGDNVCGGLPNYWHWDNVVKLYCDGLKMFDKNVMDGTFREVARDKRKLFDKQCSVSYRIAGENIDYINAIRRQVAGYNGQKMEELRVQYITGKLDEKKYKSLLSTQDNSREKKQAVLDILEIYNTVTIENFQSFIGNIQDFFGMSITDIKIDILNQTLVECCRDGSMRDHLFGLFEQFNQNIIKIRDYVNKRAWKIGYYYNQSISVVNDRGCIQPRSKVSKGELDEILLHYNSKEGIETTHSEGGAAALSESA